MVRVYLCLVLLGVGECCCKKGDGVVHLKYWLRVYGSDLCDQLDKNDLYYPVPQNCPIPSNWFPPGEQNYMEKYSKYNRTNRWKKNKAHDLDTSCLPGPTLINTIGPFAPSIPRTTRILPLLLNTHDYNSLNTTLLLVPRRKTIFSALTSRSYV